MGRRRREHFTMISRLHDKLVIRDAGLLVAGARHLAERDIFIEGGIIRDIVPPGLPVGEDVEVVDARDRIVIPGLVNSHTHSHLAWGRGFGDRWTLELHQHSGGGIWFGASTEELRLGAMLVAADLIRNGCTAVSDMVLQAPVPSPDGMSAVAEGYAAMGIRAVVAAVVADRTFWEATPGLVEGLGKADGDVIRSLVAPQADQTLDRLATVLRNWSFDRERICVGVAPTAPLLCSDDFLAAVARLARDHGAPIQTHLGESKVQAVVGWRRWGKSMTAHLAKTGFLGPDVSVGHAVWLDEPDIGCLAQCGVKVAHNPGSNMRLGNGVAPVHAMRCAGVEVGIGTDASSCADHQNMFEAARLASFASRLTSLDPEDWLGAQTTLEMASASGASILGFERIGRVAVGYRADLVFLDRRDLAYRPLNDPWTQIAFSETGRAVRAVMVDGVFVYRDGRFTGIDVETLLCRAEAASARLAEMAGDRREQLRRLEPLIARFCVGVARTPHHVDRYIGAP